MGVLQLLASGAPSPPADRWLAALAGYGVELVVLVLAIVVSLPPPLARVAGIATLGVGFAGGAVAGRLSRDPATAHRNGVLVGVAGALTTGCSCAGRCRSSCPGHAGARSGRSSTPLR